MTHPHVLWCRATAWSLNSAMGALWAVAAEEAKAIAAELAEGASDGLRSTVMGVRARGGHGDPVAGTALAGVHWEPRPNRYAQRADRTRGTLDWLANTIHAPEDPLDPLNRLLEAIPRLLPGTARRVWRELDEQDQRVRELLGLAPHLWAFPHAPECPRCGQRALYVQTAAPSPDWTVICRTGCICTGQGCPCLMPVRVEGVAHIWDRSAPFIAAALAG